MKFVTRVFLMALLAACLAATSACNGKNNQADGDMSTMTEEETDKAGLARMEAAIDDLIGEAVCGEAGDCRAIAFGAKPCGGPWKFKVYAASDVDEAELEEMVAKYNETNEALNKKHGWISDCLAVMPPEVECRDGRCVAVDDMKVKPVE
jgi:hypothetical protein